MKRFFIWKDGKYNGKDTEWLEISGEEFNRITDDEPERRFIPSYDEDDPENCDWFYYEATAEDYKEWNRERMRYLRHNKSLYKKYKVVSLDDLVDEDDEEGLTWADIIPDTSEEDAAAHEAWLEWHDKAIAALREALTELKPKELETINLIFLNNPEKKSEVELAKEKNIPRKTLNDRKLAVLKKLKKKIKEKVARNEKRVQ